MNDRKVYITDADGEGRESELAAALSGSAQILSGDDVKPLLDEADFLVLIANDARSLEEKSVSEKWNYFLDEIRWKRKAGGEVVLIDASSVSFSPSRLSYALKKCKRFRFDKTDEIKAYICEGETKAAPQTFTPPPMPVSEPPKKRETNACKEDHVFGDDLPAEKKYIRDGSASKKSTEKPSEKTTDDIKKGYDDLYKDAKWRYAPEFERKYETKDDGNPFADYPDYPKDKNERRPAVDFSKNWWVIVVIIIIVMMVLFTFIESCAFALALSGSVLPVNTLPALPKMLYLSTFFHCLI